MSQSIQDILSKTRLSTDEFTYRIVHLPANAITPAAALIAEIGAPFLTLIADRDEVTLVLSQEDYDEYQNRLRDHTISEIEYRLITFDIVLEHTLVGFLAEISRSLAQAQIPIMAFSSFERDHILIPESQFAQAMQILSEIAK